MTAAVAGGLGMVGILDVAGDGMVAGLQADVDERGLGGADAVFEGILDERNENHGRNLELRVESGKLRVDFNRLGDADAHQLDVVLKEFGFVLQGNGGLLVVIEDVAQHAREFLNGFLRLGSIESGERIDVVEGVEQEVGIDLRAQIAQLGLGASGLGILASALCLLPAQCQDDGSSDGSGNGQIGDVAQDEQQDIEQSGLDGTGAMVAEHAAGEAYPIVQEDAQGNDHDDVEQPIVAVLVRHEITGREPQVIGIEHHHHEEGRHAGHEVLQQTETAETTDERQGQQKQQSPDGYVDQKDGALTHDGWLR